MNCLARKTDALTVLYLSTGERMIRTVLDPLQRLCEDTQRHRDQQQGPHTHDSHTHTQTHTHWMLSGFPLKLTSSRHSVHKRLKAHTERERERERGEREREEGRERERERAYLKKRLIYGFCRIKYIFVASILQTLP